MLRAGILDDGHWLVRHLISCGGDTAVCTRNLQYIEILNGRLVDLKPFDFERANTSFFDGTIFVVNRKAVPYALNMLKKRFHQSEYNPFALAESMLSEGWLAKADEAGEEVALISVG